MTAPTSTRATVEAVLDFANLDREFSERLTAATQQAERVVNRNLQGITRAAQSSSNDINRAFDRIVVNIDMRSFNTSMSQTERAATSAARTVDRATDQMAESTDDAADSASSLGDSFGGLVGAAAGAAAGLVAVGGAMDLIGEAINRTDLANKLGAQLDLTKEESAQAGQIAGQVYAQNYGESFEQVTDAAGAVMSSLASLADDGGPAVEDLTKRVATLGDTFGTEAAEVAASANSLIRQGLAGDAVEALDLIGAAFQRVPAQMRDELLPLMDEYGTFFSSLGFDGQEAFGLLVNASEQGAIAMDKVGDALKETGIRATDLGDTGAVEALDAIGLGAANIQTRLLAGGDTAKAAFGEMVTALLGVTDPAEQAAQAVALFGTPLEDLNKAEIPAFLAALSGGGDAMAQFEGSVDRMGQRLAEGPGAQLELFKRQVEATLINALGTAAGFVIAHSDTFKVLGIALGVAVAAYLSLQAAAMVSSVAMGVHAAATGADTAALAANRVAMGAHAIAAVAMRAGMLAGAAATGIATAATWAFNAAMAVLTAPITLIVLAIAGFIAALVLLYNKNETFRNFVQTAWAAIQSAVGVAWEFLKGVFSAFVGWITGSLVPTLQNWWGTAQSVFDAVGAIVAYWWDNVVSPILHNAQLAIGLLGDAITWWWQNVVTPAFDAVGSVISWWWSNIVGPAFDLAKAGIGLLGDAITWWWQSVVTPAFDAVGSAVSLWWDGVQIIFDKVKSAIGLVGDAFSAAGGVMSGIWDGVLAAMRPAVHAIGNLLAKVPSKIGPVEIPGAGVAQDLGKTLQAFGTGGLARGPGTGTSDSILAAISDGEFITNAAATGRWLPLLEAINRGASSAELLELLVGMGLPAFAAGGLVSTAQLRDFARGIEGSDYAWGGWGNGWLTDCSGAASALANYVTAGLDAGAGERSGTGNMANFLAGLGAQDGIGPAGSLSFGWFNGGPYGGHIAMTLPTGEHVEMGGARGNGQFAGQAAGADDSMFTDHAHFPPEYFLGGDLGGGGGASIAPGAGSGLAGGGSGTGGSSSGTGGSSSGAGSGTAATIDPDTTKVYVTNWPSSLSTSSSATSTTTTGTDTSASSATYTGGTDTGGTQEYGVDAANKWAAEQDFGGQAQDWAFDALKEIFGEIPDMFGLKTYSDQGFDQLKTAAEALAEARASEAQPVVGTINVTGTSDPLATATAVVDQIAERMGAVTGRYRNGG